MNVDELFPIICSLRGWGVEQCERKGAGALCTQTSLYCPPHWNQSNQGHPATQSARPSHLLFIVLAGKIYFIKIIILNLFYVFHSLSASWFYAWLCCAAASVRVQVVVSASASTRSSQLARAAMGWTPRLLALLAAFKALLLLKVCWQHDRPTDQPVCQPTDQLCCAGAGAPPLLQ